MGKSVIHVMGNLLTINSAAILLILSTGNDEKSVNGIVYIIY